MTNRYKEAGVDIDAGGEFVKRIIPLVEETYRPDVLAGIGGFAAHTLLNLEGIGEPVLVSSTDGVGTKLKIAQELNRYDTIGIDLVAMCVNDILCSGARPLFFLDYFAVEKLKPAEHSEIVKGIAEGCRRAGCSLIGGETAELPGIYQKDDFDLAGFVVGIIDRRKIIDGSSISIGNVIIGISSSGAHSNGYSLIRKIIRDNGLSLNMIYDGFNKTLGDLLIAPTKVYVPLIQNLIRDFNLFGIAHITGGGLVENIPRILPSSCKANIALGSWERPRLFDFLQSCGGIEELEMRRVFNLGIGMVIIASPTDAPDIVQRVESFGDDAFIIGEITEREKGEPAIVVE